MKFWIMLILGLLVVSMSVNAKDEKAGDKDDSNDSDASNDGNNSGAEDGDTSDSTGNLNLLFCILKLSFDFHQNYARWKYKYNYMCTWSMTQD